MQRKVLFPVSLLTLFLVSSPVLASLNDDLDKPVAKGGGTVKAKVLQRIQKNLPDTAQDSDIDCRMMGWDHGTGSCIAYQSPDHTCQVMGGKWSNGGCVF